MANKITLYSDSNLINEIKQYAKEHNTSVSKLVNEFFKNILHREKINNSGSLTEQLEGILENSNIDLKDYKKHLEEKYSWKFC